MLALTALVLAPIPLGALALALRLARRLEPAERGLLALAAALSIASALLSPEAPQNDAWAHYQHLRVALLAPSYLLDPWDRPGFTLLYASPAALGLTAARLFSTVPALLALAATMRAARALGLARPWVAGLLLLAQYDFFGQAASTMTELPFAAGLAVAVLGLADGRAWVAAAGLGWVAITRPEGPLFAAIGAGLILLRLRQLPPAIAAVAPFAVYQAVGALVFHDLRWYQARSPYHGLVSLRLDLRQVLHSYFLEALRLGQPVVLRLLEALGAALALLGPARRLRFLLAPIAASFLVLTFLRIGETDAWRESRYLVEIAPALALLAAAALDEALRRLPRLAPPLLLAAAASGLVDVFFWYWFAAGYRPPFLGDALMAAFYGLALALWLARSRVPTPVALAILLALPLAGLPPGSLPHARPDSPRNGRLPTGPAPGP